jgi:hypothetical protein
MTKRVRKIATSSLKKKGRASGRRAVLAALSLLSASLGITDAASTKEASTVDHATTPNGARTERNLQIARMQGNQQKAQATSGKQSNTKQQKWDDITLTSGQRKTSAKSSKQTPHYTGQFFKYDLKQGK